MIKFLQYLFLIVLSQFTASLCYAQFPYTESFRNSTATGIIFGGAPSAFLTASGSSSNGGTPIDPNGSGYLRLTNAETNQKGYAYSTSDFPSSNGLKVEFEYCIYGGTGADGISFFLFDATANPFTIGGFGGSLGYAQITTTIPHSPGVSKGYLAIGLDEFGNFSNPNEGRQGGTTQVPGSITLRGKGNGAALTPDNYRFLITQKTDLKGVSLVGNGLARVTDPTSPSYRRVYIELIPNPAGGYNINVRLVSGGPTLVYTTIIDNYYYPDLAPENLRYGFASSTGANTNFHEIRNVAIDLYDEAPVAINDIGNFCMDKTATVDVTSNDRTLISNALDKSTVDLNPAMGGIQNTVTVSGKGVFTVNSQGVVQFVPVPGFIGSASTQYVIKDMGGQTSNIATITLNYNELPLNTSAGPDQLVNISTSTGSYTLQGNNPGANTGAWTQVSGPNTSIFTSSSTYNTTVNNLTGGVYVFRWTVTSATGCSESDDVRITVNRNPIAYNDAANTPLNTSVPISILDNDVDEDGNATINKASIIITTQPLNGTLSINYATGVVTYIPNTGFSGTDTFKYTVKDVNGAESNVANVTVSINKTLVGVDDIATTLTNVPVTVHVLDNDPKKVGASVLKVTDPTNGAIVLNADGTISYNPNLGFSGKDSFLYRLVNNNGDQSDAITVNITVKPTGQPDAKSTFTNTPTTISVKDNDNSKTGTTVQINTIPLRGTVSVTANIITYTPEAGYSGQDAFTYILRTADGLNSEPIAVDVTVRPSGANDEATTFASIPLTITVKDNDDSKNGTIVILNTAPANGTYSLTASNEVLYVPNSGFSGKDSFRYLLRTADNLESNLITVIVNVRPVGNGDNGVYTLNTPLNISVKDNDASKVGTSVIINSSPSNGTITASPAGVITYTPNTGFSGTNTFTYILRTTDGLNSEPITVTVTPSTLKPTGSPDVANTITNAAVTVPVKDNDASQTNTTVVLSTNTTSNGSVALNGSGVPVYTPATGFSGKDTFTYLLRSASNVDSDPISVTVNVKPVGSNDAQSYTLNTPVTISVKDNDLSKNNTSVILTSNPANGTVSVNSNIVTYTPNTGFNGTNTFTYILRTSDGLDSDPITVTLNPGTPVPTGSPDVANTTTNTPITIPVKDNDASQTGTTVVLTSGTTPNGTVVLNGAGIPVYTPNAGFSGKDTFTYKLSNGGLESTPITVTVNVKPIGTSDSQTYSMNTPLAISVKDNDLSKNGTAVVVTSSPANGTATTNASGVVTYTPNTGFTGTNTFTYILRTADGLDSDPITVTISANIPIPTGSPDVANTTTDVSISIPVKDNDASQLGTTVVIQTTPANGTVAINPAGVPLYTPGPGFSGKDSFTYRLNNGTVNSDPILVTINVKPVGSPDNESYTINTPLPINVKNNDLSKTNTSVIISTAPLNGTVSVNASGVVTYTPTTGFNGTNTFTYILRSTDGLDSDPILVTLTPAVTKPVGSPDVATTPTNTPVTIPVKDNDAGKTGTLVEIKTNPAHGTVVLNLDGIPVYTPATGYSGKDTFTYVLKNQDGLESDPISVTVNVKPVGSTDNTTTQLNTTVTIDIKNNDLSKTGTTPVVNTNPEHGTVNINANGNAVYTPATGYVGADTFTYKLRTADGVESDPIIVVVTVTPAVQQPKIGLAKSFVSSVQNTNGSYRISYVFTLANFANVGINQISLIDDLALTFPARIFNITRLSGSGNLVVNTAFNGTTVKEMLLPASTLAANGKETVELEVTLAAGQQGGTFLNSATAQGKSVADGTATTDISTSGLLPDPTTPGDVTPSTPTQVVLLIAPNVTVPGVTDSPVTINIPLPPGTTVVITNPPANGTITFDPVTGQPIYTPNPGYSGADQFTYVIRDANGNTSQPATASITVTAPAKIGIAKALVSNAKNIDGSFNLTYLFTLVNYGDVAIERVSLTDNLALAFPDATYQILSINTSGNLQVNTNFNGNTIVNMLLPTSTLEAKSKRQVEMQIKVTLSKDRGTFNNFAIAEGFSTGSGTLTSDQSTNGFNPDPVVAGDVRPSELTPVELIKGSLKIPAGFSPNNDGINDYFVVENTQGQKVGLEIFNRWGNRIYRAADYKNDWAGKSTEGIRVGDDVPVGTYYYVITIDGKDKRVGYITINR